MTESNSTPGPWHWEPTGGPLDPPQLVGNIEYSDCNTILMCSGCSPSCLIEYNKPCPLVPSEADQALIADAWQLPELRNEITKLKKINSELYDALYNFCMKFADNNGRLYFSDFEKVLDLLLKISDETKEYE